MKRLIALSLLALAFMAQFAYAAPATSSSREIRVYLHTEYPDCVFFIKWENADKQASAVLTDPDGTVFPLTNENTTYGKGSIAISAGAAKRGYWNVTLTGDGLGAASVSGGGKFQGGGEIKSFNAEVVGENLNFDWDIEALLDSFAVTIYYNQGAQNTTVYNSNKAPKKGSASVALNNIITGLYNFTIQIFDGNRQQSLSIGTPIYIKQPKAPEKLQNIRTGSINGEMFATWDMPLQGYCEIKLYDPVTLDVLSTEQTSQGFYAIRQDLQRVKLSVALLESNFHGDFDVYELSKTVPSGSVSFPDYTSTRESFVSLNFDCGSGETGGLYLDGTLIADDQPSGPYDLFLSEGEHEAVAYIKDQNGNMKTFAKTIIVDKTPPQISLSNKDEVKTNSQSLVVDGKTEPNAVIAINGVEQELGDGIFMAKLALKNGVNPISVTAYDAAGNKGVKTITAEKSGSRTLLPIIPLPILLTIWYVYLNIKGKGAKDK
ncbi:MAG: hypothetical protein LBT59_14235 [Clostridiales bacterium]|jgi:hypothetical protein|nr:hypothetical protein [Clostridiales bacterium]